MTTRSALFPWLLATPAVVLLAVMFVAPLALVVRVGFGESEWTIRAYADLFSGKLLLPVAAFTVALASAATILAVLIAYPVALAVHRLSPTPRALALAVVVLAKLANVFVVLYGVQLVLGRHGPVNAALTATGVVAEPLLLTQSAAGVLVAETYLLLPYAVLLLAPAFDRIDPALTAAARGLGATPWVAFFRVTLPLTLPDVVVAARLCLIWSLGAFVGPMMLGGPDEMTLSVLVQRLGLEANDYPRAAAASVVMLATVATCVGAFEVAARIALKAGGAARA